MAEVNSVRRYYLHERLKARLYEDSDLDTVWQSKQESEPGTALPDDFPLLSELTAIGYSKVEDLDGADAVELSLVGISASNARKILTALAPLL